jgi:diphthamide biosynthesis methyltransferase
MLILKLFFEGLTILTYLNICKKKRYLSFRDNAKIILLLEMENKENDTYIQESEQGTQQSFIFLE